MENQAMIVSARVFAGSLTFINRNWAFLIPALLLAYSVYACIYGDDNKKINTKRFFYTVCIFLYLLFIRLNDISGWCGVGPFNISQEIWSFFVSLIVFILISIILENLIISGFVFKEFGFFGAKFVKDESEKNLKEQKEYITLLEYSMKSIYDVSCELSELFQSEKINEQIENRTFDFCGEFSKVLNLYYKNKFENVVIQTDTYQQSAESIKKIVDKLFLQCNLSRNDKVAFEIDLLTHGRTSNYFTNKSCYFYVITEALDFMEENNMMMITIFSRKDIIASDLYAIASFFNVFKSQYTKQHNK